MKKILLLLSLSFIVSQTSFAQYGNNKPAWMENVYVGGGLNGLSISKTQITVSVSGQIGYKITEELSTGIGVNYQYYKLTDLDVSFNDYGYNVFARYNVYDPFFAMARYEVQSIVKTLGAPRSKVDALLVGGGVSQPAGNNASLNFFALYNLSYSDGSLDNGRYTSPWVIGAGINIGL